MGKLKTLIVSGRLTIEHNYRETNDRIRTLLESTGRFDVRITEEFKGATPETVSGYDLMACIPEDHWILINLDLIALGRSICKSQKPRCGECFLADVCPYGEEKEKIHV